MISGEYHILLRKGYTGSSSVNFTSYMQTNENSVGGKNDRALNMHIMTLHSKVHTHKSEKEGN